MNQKSYLLWNIFFKMKATCHYFGKIPSAERQENDSFCWNMNYWIFSPFLYTGWNPYGKVWIRRTFSVKSIFHNKNHMPLHWKICYCRKVRKWSCSGYFENRVLHHKEYSKTKYGGFWIIVNKWTSLSWKVPSSV